ncbi:MAG: sulfite exporter TauE/SafE family protein [Candidatus Kerfeldbacteria bacterium]|nr:sulfite exporter TauE/SafE family protein [Candidatus Kerfeldbacteria bacterium]
MQILLIGFLTLVGSTAGVLSGFGTSTIMVPTLTLFLPLPQVLLLVGIVHFFGDIWRLLFFRHGLRWKLILGFGIPGIAASWLGAQFVFRVPEELLSRILGGFLVAYALFILLKPNVRLRPHAWTSVAGGITSGFLSGIFGVGGAVRSVFLSVFDLPKAVYLATGAAIALVVDTSRLIPYWLGGIRLDGPMTWALLAFIPISLVGARLGKALVDRIPQGRFRMVIAVALIVVGLRFLLLPV